jgi:hypothetical protein
MRSRHLPIFFGDELLSGYRTEHVRITLKLVSAVAGFVILYGIDSLLFSHEVQHRWMRLAHHKILQRPLHLIVLERRLRSTEVERCIVIGSPGCALVDDCQAENQTIDANPQQHNVLHPNFLFERGWRHYGDGVKFDEWKMPGCLIS